MWAKHLFSQLFGEPDADNDVSPETEESEVEEGGGNGEGERMEGKVSFASTGCMSSKLVSFCLKSWEMSA